MMYNLCWGIYPDTDYYVFASWDWDEPGLSRREFHDRDDALEFLRYLAQDVCNVMELRDVLYHLGNGVHWNLQRMNDQAVLHTLAGELPDERIIVIDPALGERQDTALANHLSHCALLPNQCSPDAAIRRLGELRAAPEPDVFSNLRDIYSNHDLPRVEKIHRGMQVLFAPSYYQAKREKAPFDAASIASGAGKELGNMGLDLGELLINGVLSGISWPFGTGPFQIDLDRFEYKDAELRGAGLMQAATLAGAAGAVRNAAKQGAQHSEKSFDSRIESEKPVAQNGNTVPTGSVGGKNSGDENTVFKGKLRGSDVELPGVKTRKVQYTKRSPEETAEFRKAFRTKDRKAFLENLANDPEKAQRLKAAGLTDADIARIAEGKTPPDWQVHHKLPIDDGGDNGLDNLVLIKNEPSHKVITNAQKKLTGELKPGETKKIDFPVPEGFVYPTAPGLIKLPN